MYKIINGKIKESKENKEVLKNYEIMKHFLYKKIEKKWGGILKFINDLERNAKASIKK